MINPNNKKQIVQLEEDTYFKDLIESIKSYIVEYPKKKNFPPAVYKAAYSLVEYATNQFEDNTRKIEELIVQREKNIELSVKLREILDAVGQFFCEHLKQGYKDTTNEIIPVEEKKEKKESEGNLIEERSSEDDTD